MGLNACFCCGEGKNAEERRPLMPKTGAQPRVLAQSILASRPLPGDGFLDPTLEGLIAHMTSSDDDNPDDGSREKFEKILQGIED
jgi:hypothetical protein